MVFRWIAKILGILDIFAAVFFWLFGFFSIMSPSIILFFAFYLFVKGAIFLVTRDFASIGDIVCALIMFVSLNFSVPRPIVALVSLFLLQKGIFSLV